MSQILHIGTAGWSLSSRFSAHFPPDGSHLERYAQRLNAAEINSSFYRHHQRKTYEKWAESVPDSFSFAVKLPKAITHDARLADDGETLARFADEVTGLGSKLGVILIQLPPSLRLDKAVAERCFAAIRARIPSPIAVEPRHRSWFQPSVDTWLASLTIARVAADPAVAPGAGEPGGWDGLAYYRWHGSPQIYHSAYENGDLARLFKRLQVSCARGAATWCIFDNTASGAALSNALELTALSDHSHSIVPGGFDVTS